MFKGSWGADPVNVDLLNHHFEWSIQMDWFNSLTLVASIAALVISILSWFAAIHANRAALFDRRFEVYRDAEAFVGAWQRHGKPDMEKLRQLVDAWNRSHFLFEQDVTKYLRQLWLDAVSADFHEKVIAGAAEGDREKSIEIAQQLSRHHMESETLRNAFLPHLKVSDGYLLRAGQIRLQSHERIG